MAGEAEEEGEGLTTMSDAALARLIRMDGKLGTVVEKLGELTDATEAQLAWKTKALTLLMNPSRNFLILVALMVLAGGAVSANEMASLMFGDCDCECDEEEAFNGS